MGTGAARRFGPWVAGLGVASLLAATGPVAADPVPTHNTFWVTDRSATPSRTIGVIAVDRDNPRLWIDGPELMCFAGKRRAGTGWFVGGHDNGYGHFYRHEVRVRVRDDGTMVLQDRDRPGPWIRTVRYERVTKQRYLYFARAYDEPFRDLWWDCPAV